MNDPMVVDHILYKLLEVGLLVYLIDVGKTWGKSVTTHINKTSLTSVLAK